MKERRLCRPCREEKHHLCRGDCTCTYGSNTDTGTIPHRLHVWDVRVMQKIVGGPTPLYGIEEHRHARHLVELGAAREGRNNRWSLTAAGMEWFKDWWWESDHEPTHEVLYRPTFRVRVAIPPWTNRKDAARILSALPSAWNDEFQDHRLEEWGPRLEPYLEAPYDAVLGDDYATVEVINDGSTSENEELI